MYKLTSSTWGEEEITALEEVIKSGNFTMGEKVRRFEKMFADYIGVKYALMVNSGSSANLLSIAALFANGNLKRGDEVIVPCLGWSTSYFPLQQYGLHCKFIDVDLETLNYNPVVLGEAITPKTKAILLINVLGNPNDYDAIQKLILGKDIILLEDNCEGMGAEYNGRMAGSFGLTGTFSMFYSHHISTMEGGIVVTDDEKLYHTLICLRSHGWTRHLPDENLVIKKSKNSFEESYRFILPGYNLRPGEMHGAAGIEQLKKLPEFLKARRYNAEYFKNKIKDRHITQKEIGKSSWHGFSILVEDRAEYLKYLDKKGVEYRPVISGNFLNNPVMEYFDYSIHGEINNVEYIDKHGLFVGNHHYKLTKEIELL